MRSATEKKVSFFTRPRYLYQEVSRWLTPEDEVGRRVLVASKNDGLLYDFLRERLLESHRELRNAPLLV
ncbi:MAG: hypothetical protein JOZ31_09310 [Verrucomicrobia bacterium]|nr:hypothetical protein [Verrucomicrobiota bacterium]